MMCLCLSAGGVQGLWEPGRCVCVSGRSPRSCEVLPAAVKSGSEGQRSEDGGRRLLSARISSQVTESTETLDCVVLHSYILVYIWFIHLHLLSNLYYFLSPILCLDSHFIFICMIFFFLLLHI